MYFDIKKTENISKLLAAVPENNYSRALNDAIQVILISTKRRYMEQISPDGTPWAPNWNDYQEMKGGAAVLTGPVTSKIKGGRYSGKYEFKEVNKKRMKNSLIHEVDASMKRAVIFYDDDSKERAALHQLGGEVKLILSSTTGGKDKVFFVDVPARPHLGISDEDARRIEEVFGEMMEYTLSEGA